MTDEEAERDIREAIQDMRDRAAMAAASKAQAAEFERDLARLLPGGWSASAQLSWELANATVRTSRGRGRPAKR